MPSQRKYNRARFDGIQSRCKNEKEIKSRKYTSQIRRGKKGSFQHHWNWQATPPHSSTIPHPHPSRFCRLPPARGELVEGKNSRPFRFRGGIHNTWCRSDHRVILDFFIIFCFGPSFSYKQAILSSRLIRRCCQIGENLLSEAKSRLRRGSVQEYERDIRFPKVLERVRNCCFT